MKLFALAHDLGVSQSAISRWRSGGNISLENLTRLCDRLHVSADWVLLGRLPRPPQDTRSVSVLWGDPLA